jgi:hypothetical protein
MPPRALERITYTVVVTDKKTQEPIANGEGRIFATNADRKTVWNGFTYGPEVGHVPRDDHVRHRRRLGPWHPVPARLHRGAAAHARLAPDRPERSAAGRVRTPRSSSILHPPSAPFMRHFHRTSLHPDAVLATADAFFPTIGLRPAGEGPRSRTFTGVVGTPEVPATLELTVRMEGGHYTFIEAHTDQMGRAASTAT